MDLDLKDPKLWIVAIILGAIAAYLLGPLIFKPAPLDILLKGPTNEVRITGLSEILLFIIVIRVVLGADAAKDALDRLV